MALGVVPLMQESHLAHLNVARMRGSLDSPVMSEFVARLGAINAIADAAEAFHFRRLFAPPRGARET